MKRKKPKLWLISIISALIFSVSLFWTLVFEPDLSVTGLLILLVVIVASLFTFIMSLIVLAVKNLFSKKAITNEVKIVIFWKWINIISVFSIILLSLFSLFQKKNYFYNQWAGVYPKIPELFVNLWIIFILILSIVVIYGIIKKYKMVYYSSLFQLLIITLVNALYLLKAESILHFGFLFIPVILYIFIASYIFKSKRYFGIK